MMIAQEIKCVFDAVNDGDVDAVRGYLDSGGKAYLRMADSYDPEDSFTLFVQAAIEDNLEIMQLLLDRGADINEKQGCGVTALHAAASSGKKRAVQFLAEHKADLNIRDDGGNTPLHRAMSGSDRDDMVQLLLDLGASPEMKNRDGLTPLGWARRWRKAKSIAILEAYKSPRPGSKTADTHPPTIDFGDRNPTIRELRRSVSERRDDADVHFALGVALADGAAGPARDLRAAAAQMREVIRLRPDLIEARHRFFGWLLAAGAFTEIGDAVRQMRKDPNTPVSYRPKLAEVQREAAKRQWLLGYLCHHYDDPQAREKVARYLFGTPGVQDINEKDLGRAATLYELALGIDPDCSEAKALLGEVQQDQRQDVAARQRAVREEEAARQRAAQEAEAQRRAQIQEERRAHGLCTMCGKKLGFFEKLGGSGKHGGCTTFQE